MGLSREDIERSCEQILGRIVYRALWSVRTPLPKILSMAGEKAFIQNMSGDDVEAVREALRHLTEGGFLPGREDKK